jgi:hypothetical protein
MRLTGLLEVFIGQSRASGHPQRLKFLVAHRPQLLFRRQEPVTFQFLDAGVKVHAGLPSGVLTRFSKLSNSTSRASPARACRMLVA